VRCQEAVRGNRQEDGHWMAIHNGVAHGRQLPGRSISSLPARSARTYRRAQSDYFFAIMFLMMPTMTVSPMPPIPINRVAEYAPTRNHAQGRATAQHRAENLATQDASDVVAYLRQPFDAGGVTLHRCSSS
jgi:hypothetical protein